jgi:hypothetical protein
MDCHLDNCQQIYYSKPEMTDYVSFSVNSGSDLMPGKDLLKAIVQPFSLLISFHKA